MLAILRVWFSLSFPLRYSEYLTSLPSPLTSEIPPTIWSSPPNVPRRTMKLKAPYGCSRTAMGVPPVQGVCGGRSALLCVRGPLADPEDHKFGRVRGRHPDQ